jgi:hypothetical protein
MALRCSADCGERQAQNHPGARDVVGFTKCRSQAAALGAGYFCKPPIYEKFLKLGEIVKELLKDNGLLNGRASGLRTRRL